LRTLVTNVKFPVTATCVFIWLNP